MDFGPEKCVEKRSFPPSNMTVDKLARNFGDELSQWGSLPLSAQSNRTPLRHFLLHFAPKSDTFEHVKEDIKGC